MTVKENSYIFMKLSHQKYEVVKLFCLLISDRLGSLKK